LSAAAASGGGATGASFCAASLSGRPVIGEPGGSAGDAATYLAQPSVAYSTAAGAYKQKIGFQKWIAMFNRPFEGWTELRRLDFPVLTAPVAAKSGFPNRFTFPGNEQQLNGTNYTDAATKVGGDKVETKLFWDKF